MASWIFFFLFLIFRVIIIISGGSAVKNPPAKVGDVGSIPGLGKSLGEGMATHSGILAWRIPWAADSAGYSLQSGKELDTTKQLLISFRMDWLDLLAVQGTLKSLLQHTVQKHQFFGAQLSLESNSYPYMTTRKNIALTRQTFVGKVMSLLFNMLSRLVITFLLRSKCLLILWL